MEDRKSRVRQWNSFQEELEDLENDPTAQALLELLDGQDSERVGQLMEELTDLAEEEGTSHED